MPSTYFENHRLKHLELLFARAMAILERHQSAPKEMRDVIAARILSCAANGDHDDEAILKYALQGLVPESIQQQAEAETGATPS